MSREVKKNNILKQISANNDKIHKLNVINSQLREQYSKLSMEPVKPEPPTEEERKVQSENDKKRFREIVQSHRFTNPD